ncbi:MAG: 2-oxoacid:acceptor oxidoreductase family protein [candidate division WOR-3 bacterium]|nr:2-oxoacid:acceptor oxidoreductase family protein [candidate division WOR-3 bacterium]MCX7757456.1 2-oxoacid:acceptor oxidoreductase family protein [candidate division WOR-3 bacterium]MDW7987903.1 2-oxoacid:acceptor oxidoreductase family protein [candidate division WOR-3 bacterium]
MYKEIRLAGTGGQGLILAGVILAEAVGVYEGKKVIQTQSYGPEARGGASRTDVIISDTDILYPKARHLDILACLSQKSYDSYINDLKEGGIVIYDTFYVQATAANKGYGLPLAIRTRERFGREIFMNIVLLGALAEITGIVKIESLKKAVANHVPKVTLEHNLKALELGSEIGRGK